ncbi:MAG: hypothetical protein RR712_00405 [Terrisporobacter sp.]|uniref:hypothetical protein n=1 Tax=Terrisporobacter sp. TaxID=1965305 RepID=UPI002FC94ECB
MSRVEKTQNDKVAKKPYKLIYKIIFISIMVILTGSSIFLIDFRVNNMLGNENENVISSYIDIFN